MNKKYILQPNSKIKLIPAQNNTLGISLKEENKPFLFLHSQNIYIEELVQEQQNISQLVEIYPIQTEGKQQFRLNIIQINLSNKRYFTTTIITTKIPKKITPNIYKYVDQNNKICLLNTKQIEIIPLENKIRSWLKNKNVEITNMNLKYLDGTKDPTIQELTITLNDIETLHFYLKINDQTNYKVYNIYYSELLNGMELKFYPHREKNIYITESTFQFWLTRNQIIENLEDIQKNNHSQKPNIQNKIKTKINKKIFKSKR